ncbi:hypothetical protein Trco_007567 [Trichoderma cornu-damae]|uniref:Uncharacterized protein n=1 Tax=Trichoderma cornu-damae TaxID=654480 RepID=A0A9P8QEG4_9HYPO|nr:hypothetical protein Trco_007567 [Trichoderma cornu-damae]
MAHHHHHQHQHQHHHYPQHHGGGGYSLPPFAVELDTCTRSQQLEGQVFEMSGESAAPRAQEPSGRPAPAQEREQGAVQANPWPFYLDREVRTESQSRSRADGEAEQPPANPWPYFGPVSPDEGADERGGLGIRVEEEQSDAVAGGEDAPALPLPPPAASSPSAAAATTAPPPHRSSPDGRGGHGAPPAPGASSPSASFYPAPLRLSRKQLPPPEAAASQGDPAAAAAAALPYRPYRPAGRTPSPQPHGPLAVGAAAPPAVPVSPNLPQQWQQQVAGLPGSMEAPPDGAAPHYFHQPPPPAGPRPPLLLPPPPPAAPAAAAALPVAPPPPPPPVPGPVPTVAVAEPSSVAAPAPHHAFQHASFHPPPSPSNSGPITGRPSSSSPVPGHLAYGLPHSAPASSMPSPETATFYQFQPIGQAYPQNLYSVAAHTPPTASPAPASPYPPPQQFTPPPPASGYHIPQPVYAVYASSAAGDPPPQPPRPQSNQPAAGAYQPQPSPSLPPPPYMYGMAPRPGTQPPPSPSQPPSYGLPYGPAIAPHQHQYPTQPTYAAPNSYPVPPSPNPHDPYASPPLPPRPATAHGSSQPQLFAGFTPHLVAYPPPPRRVFDPPPAAPLAPPRRPSGAAGGGRLFSSSSALKWIDKTGKGLENRLDAVLGSQGSSNRPPPQPPRPS